MDMYESLNYVSKLAFPRIKYTWDGLSINEEKPIFRISIFTNKVEDYIEDYYEKGLKSLLKVIECGNLSSEVAFYAKQLLVVLADDTINNHSNICKNKAEIACKLYKKNPIFRENVIQYAPYLYKLIPNLIASSFFHLDDKTVKDVCDNCIHKCRGETKLFAQLLDKLHDEFTYNHSFSNLVTEDNILKYWKISEYINTAIPELNFYDVRDGQIVYEIKQDIDELKELKPLIKLIEAERYWINVNTIPSLIEFEYIFPNGSNSDMIKYILNEYGETFEIDVNRWHGRISKKYIDLFEVFSNVTDRITEDPRFTNLYQEHHTPTILSTKLWQRHSNATRHLKVFKNIEQLIYVCKGNRRAKRNELYNQLIKSGGTTAKWKSEVQLFNLVSGIYPDAIYQYKPLWLGLQSLDIFIPSLSIGIEYQGEQHYRPIAHFGGEGHFLHQKENDKKKKMLCIKNGVVLIEWPYTEAITKENLEKYISDEVKKHNNRN